MLRGDALRMELDSVHRKTAVSKTHDQSGGLGSYNKLGRKRRAIDYEGMITRCLERARDAAENAFSAMGDFRELAVHGSRGTHYLAPKRLSHGLVAETHPENWDDRTQIGNKRQANACLARRAGSGGEHYRLRIHPDHLMHRNLVIAMDYNIRTEPAQIMDKIKSEAIVIIDQNDHGFTRPLKVLNFDLETVKKHKCTAAKRGADDDPSFKAVQGDADRL